MKNWKKSESTLSERRNLIDNIYKSSFYYIRLMHAATIMIFFFPFLFLLKHYDNPYSQIIVITLFFIIMGLKKTYIINTLTKESKAIISFYGMMISTTKITIKNIEKLGLKKSLSPGILSYSSYERNLLELTFISKSSPTINSIMICKMEKLNDLKQIKY